MGYEQLDGLGPLSVRVCGRYHGTTFQLSCAVTTVYVGYICLLMFISAYISVLARSSTVVLGMGPRGLTLLMPFVLWAWGRFNINL